MKIARRTQTAHRLARQSAELSLTAPFVIAQRLARFAQPDAFFHADNRMEFARMSGEKIAAAQLSWFALYEQGWRMQFELMRMATTVFFGGPWTLVRRGPRSLDFAGAALAGLAPFRTRVLGNAKRLSRGRSRRGVSPIGWK